MSNRRSLSPRVSCRRWALVAAVVAAPVILTSCSFGPAPIKQPSINASQAGKLAMEQYDTNGDGVVSGGELDQAPGLKAALPRLDTNGDKGVSADEVTARVNAWKAMETGMTMVMCRVTLDGQPLGGANVVFEPEACLGDDIKSAIATSNMYGDAMLSVPLEVRGPKLPGGVQLGLFKVRVSKMVNGKETLPARYNTKTVLGQEVSYDDPAIQNRNVAFALKSGT